MYTIENTLLSRFIIKCKTFNVWNFGFYNNEECFVKVICGYSSAISRGRMLCLPRSCQALSARWIHLGNGWMSRGGLASWSAGTGAQHSGDGSPAPSLHHRLPQGKCGWCMAGNSEYRSLRGRNWSKHTGVYTSRLALNRSRRMIQSLSLGRVLAVIGLQPH